MGYQELLVRLIEAVERQSKSPQWNDIINLLSVIAAWLTIAMLLKERYEKNRPYLQISFELIRSSLACIVIRNTGTCPLEVKSLRFNDEFVGQLPIQKQEALKKYLSTDITIFPNRHWVLSLDVNVFEIINNFDQKTVDIDYSYTKIGKQRKYSEHIAIDFTEYAGMLVYISELDEFKNSVDKLNNTFKKSVIDMTKLSKEFKEYIKSK